MNQSDYLNRKDVETILAGFGVRLELPEPDRIRAGCSEWRRATIARLIRDTPRRRLDRARPERGSGAPVDRPLDPLAILAPCPATRASLASENVSLSP